VADARIPSFARDYPRAAELDALVEAFARGDYARVRREAPQLATSSTDARVRTAARELHTRTRPDPLAVVLLALTAALLVALGGFWMVHGKAPPARPLPASTR
jgi:hypothetical protein